MPSPSSICLVYSTLEVTAYGRRPVPPTEGTRFAKSKDSNELRISRPLMGMSAVGHVDIVGHRNERGPKR